MTAPRFLLTVAATVLAPAAIAGAVVFVALDRWMARRAVLYLPAIADEAWSWLDMVNERPAT